MDYDYSMDVFDSSDEDLFFPSSSYFSSVDNLASADLGRPSLRRNCRILLPTSDTGIITTIIIYIIIIFIIITFLMGARSNRNAAIKHFI